MLPLHNPRGPPRPYKVQRGAYIGYSDIFPHVI